MISRRVFIKTAANRRITTRGYQSASERLFADAEKEEKDEEAARLKEKLDQRLKRDENWTGEEKVEDTVLRMLVDKYKPLRSGTIQTAEQRLKASPPQVTNRSLTDYNSSRNREDEVILPGIEGHKPWMTTYRTPSFAVEPSIRNMRLPPQQITKRSLVDESMPVKGPTREERARAADANRLMSAREQMLDYRFGGPGGSGSVTTEGARANPKSMKGWKSLVEERIEEARNRGAFSNLSGVGKPLQKSVQEQNPFISNQEFLLNGLVKRNGAAPPWVELQQEMETGVATFRNILQSAWIRRATRSLPLTHGYDPTFPSRLTASYLSNLRDVEWEEREKSYHEHAVREVNSLIRKYNGIAPYSVRRGLLNREGELNRCYQDSGERILEELKAMKTAGSTSGSRTKRTQQQDEFPESKEPSLWMQFIEALRSFLRLQV